jgi:hypothetical protein
MTTTASATPNSVNHDRHAGLNRRRARAQAATIGKTDPAILTGRHQAETRAVRFAKLEATQGRAMQQDGRQQQVALTGLGRLAVDGERDQGAVARNETVEQAGLRYGVGHHGTLAHSMCS